MTLLTASVCSLLLISIAFSEVLFNERFSYDSVDSSSWNPTSAPELQGIWKLNQGDHAFHGNEEGGKVLVVDSPAQRHAIAFTLPTSINIADHDEFVFQFSARFKSLVCGGGYIKALSDPGNPFNNETPYTVMFGPDLCGVTNQVRLIFRHKSPVTGLYTEHHAQNTPPIINDEFTHLYSFSVLKDGTVIIKIDQKEKVRLSLLSENDFSPSIIPSKTIPDPDDVKPSTWNDQAKIPDPSQTKPADWDEDAPKMIPDSNAVKPSTWQDDEPLEIPDPKAEMPENWDTEEDGKWEPPKIDNPACATGQCGVWSPPMIANPDYKGKWSPSLIDNPDYDGVWAPRQIPNPEYFTSDDPRQEFAPIAALGFEIWTMQSGTEFDDICIANSFADAEKFASETWAVKLAAEKKAHAEIAPPASDTSTHQEKSSDWISQTMESIVDAVAPYVHIVSENPFPFLATFLSGLAVFIIYMWKQAGSATKELSKHAAEAVKKTAYVNGVTQEASTSGKDKTGDDSDDEDDDESEEGD